MSDLIDRQAAIEALMEEFKRIPTTLKAYHSHSQRLQGVRIASIMN